MKFTNDIRARIVSAILADIPVIDHADAMRKRALAVAREAAPDAVRKMLDGPNAHWVNLESVYCDCMSFRVPAADYNAARDLSAALKADADFDAAHKAHDAQREQIAGLRFSLKANLASCSSRKAFVERFPDLAKYAPAESAPPANLPATTSLMDNLKAAGLPVEAGGDA